MRQVPEAPKKEKGCKICIFGLIEENKITHLTEKDIKSYFDVCGRIDSIEIPADHITRKAKGYVVVEFSRPYEADDAVSSIDGMELNGRRVKVQILTDQLMKQITLKESKKQGESLNEESGGAYIHTQQARATLMQRLMEGRDMGDMEKFKQANAAAKDDSGRL
jgi:RNA recognition motif-containing protein